ncbi:MAG TPA: hypothetical protein EYQ00_14865 [Dehalococcoidia bacterium]|nr:hypothetical protein [Dehalococcoidia bacterium]
MSKEEKTNEDEEEPTQEKDELGFNYWETVTQDELKLGKKRPKNLRSSEANFIYGIGRCR